MPADPAILPKVASYEHTPLLNDPWFEEKGEVCRSSEPETRRRVNTHMTIYCLHKKRTGFKRTQSPVFDIEGARDSSPYLAQLDGHLERIPRPRHLRSRRTRCSARLAARKADELSASPTSSRSSGSIPSSRPESPSESDTREKSRKSKRADSSKQATRRSRRQEKPKTAVRVSRSGRAINFKFLERQASSSSEEDSNSVHSDCESTTRANELTEDDNAPHSEPEAQHQEASPQRTTKLSVQTLVPNGGGDESRVDGCVDQGSPQLSITTAVATPTINKQAGVCRDPDLLVNSFAVPAVRVKQEVRELDHCYLDAKHVDLGVVSSATRRQTRATSRTAKRVRVKSESLSESVTLPRTLRTRRVIAPNSVAVSKPTITRTLRSGKVVGADPSAVATPMVTRAQSASQMKKEPDSGKSTRTKGARAKRTSSADPKRSNRGRRTNLDEMSRTNEMEKTQGKLRSHVTVKNEQRTNAVRVEEEFKENRRITRQGFQPKRAKERRNRSMSCSEQQPPTKRICKRATSLIGVWKRSRPMEPPLSHNDGQNALVG